MKTCRLHLKKIQTQPTQKKPQTLPQINFFIPFTVSVTLSSSQSTLLNSTSYLNNDPQFFKNPFFYEPISKPICLNLGMLTWKTEGTVPQGDFHWQPRRVTGSCQRESLGGMPAGFKGAAQGPTHMAFVALQEIQPRQPVAL